MVNNLWGDTGHRPKLCKRLDFCAATFSNIHRAHLTSTWVSASPSEFGAQAEPFSASLVSGDEIFENVEVWACTRHPFNFFCSFYFKHRDITGRQGLWMISSTLKSPFLFRFCAVFVKKTRYDFLHQAGRRQQGRVSSSKNGEKEKRGNVIPWLFYSGYVLKHKNNPVGRCHITGFCVNSAKVKAFSSPLWGIFLMKCILHVYSSIISSIGLWWRLLYMVGFNLTLLRSICQG